MRVQLTRLRRIRTCGNEKHACYFVCGFVQRDAVLERVDDSLRRRLETHDLVQDWPFEIEIDEGDATSFTRRDARDVPGRLRRPMEIRRRRQERHQRLSVDERRDQMAPP